MRRLVTHAVLTCLLLLSQQLGMVHAISHLAEDLSAASRKTPLPAELQCEECLAFAAIGAGLTGSPPAVSPLPAATAMPVAVLHVNPFPAPLRAFDSRAPPALA